MIGCDWGLSDNHHSNSDEDFHSLNKICDSCTQTVGLPYFVSQKNRESDGRARIVSFEAHERTV